LIGLVRLEQDLLIERGMLNVCSNDDRVLLSPVEELSSSQRYTQEQHAIVVAMMTILDKV
jgi:hypothetical protein